MPNSLVLRDLRLTDGRCVDLAIEDGRIESIVPVADKGTRTYVSSGWIDLHVHAFPALDPYGDEIDDIGVKQGVTTVVDAGSCGSDRIAELYASRSRARTKLLALLNVSRIGLGRIDELSDLAWIDGRAATETVSLYPEFVVGLKARMSRSVVGDNGIEPLRRALAIAEDTALPLMAHVGSGPPDVREVVALLRRGDVVTHYLNGKPNNLFDESGRPLPELSEAIARGVRLDVGHGTASFSFRVAEAARRRGIAPDTISSDIYRGNRLNGPVYSLANVLTKFLRLGYSLEETISRVTSHAAEWLGKPALGEIREGGQADLTLFQVAAGPVTLTDSEGATRTAVMKIEPKGVVVGGEYIACEIRT